MTNELLRKRTDEPGRARKDSGNSLLDSYVMLCHVEPGPSNLMGPWCGGPSIESSRQCQTRNPAPGFGDEYKFACVIDGVLDPVILFRSYNGTANLSGNPPFNEEKGAPEAVTDFVSCQETRGGRRTQHASQASSNKLMSVQEAE